MSRPARAKNVTQPVSQSGWTFLFGLNDCRRQDLFNRKENLPSKLLQPFAVHPQELQDASHFVILLTLHYSSCSLVRL